MKVTGADGLVVSQFNHECAGQTVFHVHYHLVPRYIGEKVDKHAHKPGNMEEIKALAEILAKELAAI